MPSPAPINNPLRKARSVTLRDRRRATAICSVRRTKKVKNGYLLWDWPVLGPSPRRKDRRANRDGDRRGCPLLQWAPRLAAPDIPGMRGLQGTDPVPESPTDPWRSHRNLKEKGHRRKKQKEKRQKNEYPEFLLHRDSDCCQIGDDLLRA